MQYRVNTKISKKNCIFYGCKQILMCLQFMEVSRQLDGYGKIFFPHCVCDSRKDGHVIAVVGLQCFQLQACEVDGTPEV